MSVKDTIIKILTENKGSVVSGQQMAEQLGVSRTAVWKGINSLKAEGFNICQKVGGGYYLHLDDDKLSKNAILSNITKDINIDLTILEEVDSTNNYLKNIAVGGVNQDAVVLAEHQTSGKGRLGRSFSSPKGKGLYMSLLLKPSAQTPINMLTIYAALAVCQSVEMQTVSKAEIKWVNDIFLKGKKVCGILTEAGITAESGLIDWAIVGIGVNTSAAATDFTSEVAKVATSVSQVGDFADRNKLAADILVHFYSYYNCGDIKTAIELYRQRQFILGKSLTVVRGLESFEATALDLDPQGHLIVKKEDGTVITLMSGEVSLRNWDK